MVDNLHAERLGLALQVAPDAAHAQDPQRLAPRVVAQRGRRLAAPLALTQGRHARVEVAQGAEDQEHVHVGGGVVGGRGDVGDAQRRVARAAGVDVDLVVAGSCGGVRKMNMGGGGVKE